MERTGFLFDEPSLVNGIARLVDLGNTLDAYNYSNSSMEADCKALKSDWQAVGDDMRKAIGTYEKSQEE